MKKLTIIFFLLFSHLIAAGTSHAGSESFITASDFIKASEAKETKEKMKTYAGGLANGITWANTELEKTRNKPLFCLAKNEELKDTHILGLAKAHVKRFPHVSAFPVGLVVIKELTEFYPC